MNILLVEDDAMLQKSLSYFLRANEFKVTDFDNGLDALNYLNSEIENVDLVITDLNLPFAGGQQVIQDIRKNKQSDLPIIVLTSSGVEATELEIFDLGADEFITKPFSPQVLLRRIDKLLPKN
ncbi:response regulator transcription factor [Salegentibacter sp. HM20]